MTDKLPRPRATGPSIDGEPLVRAPETSADRRCADVIARTIPEIVLGLWTLVGVEVISDRNHGRTRITEVRAEITNHMTDSTRTLALVLKHHPPEGGWAADHAARRLRAAGLAGPPFTVVRTLGTAPDGTLVAETAAGQPWAESLVGESAAARGAEAVAHFLCALQETRAVLPPVPEVQRHTDSELRGLLDLAAHRLPGATRHLEALAEHLDSALTTAAGAGPVPSHGDLHPRNVFLDPAQEQFRYPAVTVIDLDHAGLREPAADLGYALCQVLVTAGHLGLVLEQSARTAHELWCAYRRAGGPASDERIAVQTARAFVQVLHFEQVGFGGAPIESLSFWASVAVQICREGPGALHRLGVHGTGWR
ncbi:phosphotransferase family protein [Streptomyces sp. NPDC059398]|uniref:phosphotransferase family protein n=1 Tax=Streptomyces sp. NPDC059398 TaxID=3346820 RepID=UPI0036943F9A